MIQNLIKLMTAMHPTDSNGETVYKDEAAYEIVGILKSMGVIP